MSSQTPPAEPGTVDSILALVARLYSGSPRVRRDGVLRAAPADEPEGPAAIHDRVEAAEQEAAEGLLDKLPFGILVVDGTCRCEYANRIAREALATGDYVGLVGGIVRAATEQDTQSLAMLARKVAARSAPLPPDGTPVLMRRTGGGRVRLLPMPLDVLGQPRLALLLPNEARARVLRRVLVRLFGLSGAEADVAMLMLDGLSLDDVARARGITLSTARTHWQTAAAKVAGGPGELLLGILQCALLLPIDEPARRVILAGRTCAGRDSRRSRRGTRRRWTGG